MLDNFAGAFPEASPKPIHAFRAPGRVNLIGEHTDYNEGFVMPGAITFDTSVACAANNSRQLTVRSAQEKQTFNLALDQAIPQRRGNWTDYVRGVHLEVSRLTGESRGASILIDGHVPIGAGLSSSAALEVAAALAFLAIAGKTVDTAEVAKMCQRAENNFVGARCGIMDQFSSVSGRADHAVLLDCRSLEARYVRLPEHFQIVICNSMVKHSVAAGEYNQRRAECEKSVSYLRSKIPEIKSLRDVTFDDLQQYGSGLSNALLRRCRHVIRENARVLQAARAFENHDLGSAGELMYESHVSLRDDYQVSCRELDLLVQFASKIEGVYGARMTGGGFGGCTVNLVHQDAIEQFKRELSARYERETGIRPEIYITALANGAGPLD